MKYRKKPVIVEAIQWFKNGDHDKVISPPPHEYEEALFYSLENGVNLKSLGIIKTLEGLQIVCPTDWIIEGVVGEFYPCKAYVFEQTYEPC